MHSTKTRGVVSMSVAIAVLSIVGCSDDNAPEGQGYARAVVSDNPTSVNPSVAGPSSRQASSPSAPGSGASQYSGNITGDASVAVSADGVVWFDLGSPKHVTIAAQSTTDEADVYGEVQIPAGVYSRVRLTLNNAEVHLNAGGVIGTLTLTSAVTISIGGGGQVVIEKQVAPFTVSANAQARTEILFDLNSEMWVDEQSAQSGDADEAEMEDATEARTQETNRGPE